MGLMLGILSVGLALLSVVISYLDAKDETRNKIHSSVKWLVGSTGKLLPYLFVAVVCLLSLAGIIFFAFDSNPMRRIEVVMVICHFINLGMYGHILLSGRLSKLDKGSESSPELAT